MQIPNARLLADGKPLLQMWVGNFYEPYYSDRERVATELLRLRDLGFNTINLDSKAWADFQARYAGAAASPYVAMQEWMMERCRAAGLNYSFLALYLNGDNLYPNIRDVPPVRGEDAVGVDGRSLNTYKYWSPVAQQAMVDHVAGLMRLYGGAGHLRWANGQRPVQTMFDPILKPSFDVEGWGRYVTWLRGAYHQQIGEFNAAYGLELRSFDELTPELGWYRPEKVRYCACAFPEENDFVTGSPALRRWLDNQRWLVEETVAYFAAMRQRFAELDKSLCAAPVLQQWGGFFNPDFHVWDSATRALDLWRIAEHVDDAMFMAVPIHPEGRTDTRVLSAEWGIARSINAQRPFTVGLNLVRHDCRPGLAVAAAAATGASGLHVYGWSGLDDGGVLGWMDADWQEDFSRGVRWLGRVIPRLDAPRRREAALLFPNAMALYQPRSADRRGIDYRADLLGWWSVLTEQGWHVDMLHPDQVKSGALADYQVLALPHDSLYERLPDRDLERALRAWVTEGGFVACGAGCAVARRALDYGEHAIIRDCLQFRGRRVTPDGWSTVALEGLEPLARWERRDGTAIGQRRIGRGWLWVCGFEYGRACDRQHPAAVPEGYGRAEAHPVILLPAAPLTVALQDAGLAPAWRGRKGLELAQFGNSLVALNHRSVQTALPPLEFAETDGEYLVQPHALPPLGFAWFRVR
jgi:hypothetical protein